MPIVVLSICIATGNKPELLASLLEHLLRLPQLPFSAEIVVSGDATHDETATVLESYRSRLPLRILHQPESVDVGANSAAALRSSRGRYALTLDEEDRIDFEALERRVDDLTAKPGIVMMNVAALHWDELEGEVLSPSYAIDEPVGFSPDQGLDCFNFLAAHTILPTVAIYRTDVLNKLLLRSHQLDDPLVMLFRALRYGEVCFHPDSYYRSVVRSERDADDATHDGKMADQQMPAFDAYRGALEVSLLSVLKSLVPLPLPSDLRQQAMLMVNNFLVAKIRLSIQQCLASRDFIAAHELHLRTLVWRSDVNEKELQEWEDNYLVRVAVHSTLKVYDLLRFLKGLVVCGFSDADEVLSAFGLCVPRVDVLVRGIKEAQSASDRHDFMYLVEEPEDITRLVEAGVASGHIVCLSDVMVQYRSLPREALE